MLKFTTVLVAHLCENPRIAAEIGTSKGYLKLCLSTTNDLSLSAFILQIQHCSGRKRRPTEPSVREDRVQLEKAVCFAAL